ncbi:MAG: hypothetical protein FWD79_11725 [Desulfobulbus sp.]|nr:hypothetical protein [Desulfobulbus sp.]
MTAQQLAVHVALLKSRAESGVDYSPRFGALCPSCGKPAKIVRTLSWEGDTRIRYHRCLTPGCILSSINQSIKSVEIDR